MISEIPQDILVMVRVAKCHITYSPRYNGIVISHGNMSEVLFCKTNEDLKKKVVQFMDSIDKLKGAQS